MNRLVHRLLSAAALPSLLLVAAAVPGCGKKKVENAPAFDADAKSGADSKRSGAQLIQPNTVVTDDVNFDQQDQTDWKQIELKGNPGVLSVELHWDNANADLNCDVFNSFGEQIGASPGPTAGGQMKKVAAQIDKPGVYFIRVQAAKKADFSVYTLQSKWDGDAPAAPPPVAPPPAPEPAAPKEKRPHVTHAPAAPKVKKFDPSNGVQGRIVSSYREGGNLVLHIDKGSAAGVKVGSTGAILDGPSGANPLPGGDITIDKVIDEGKSVGHTGLKSIGRNTRISINAK